MSIKQKFESIDQSQLSENQKEILGKIKTATKDFTITDQKALEKVDGALDNIITKLKATNPQAIKVEAKKREPRAKKEVVKKEPKSETKKPKEAKKEAGGKRTIFSIAKEIRKADESWEDAKARAKKVMETEKVDTTKKMKSETDKLLSFIKRRKELEGLSGTSVKKDSKIEALPKGRRISKKGWKNQHGESEGGKVYYENRDNRTDRLAPNFADKIYLATGGGVGKKLTAGVYRVGKPIKVGKMYEQKVAIISDNGQVRSNSEFGITKTDFISMKNPMITEKQFYSLNSYADGGSLTLTPETPLARGLGISYTGLVGETGAMSSGEMFAGGGGISNYDIDRFKQIANNSVIARYKVRLNASFGNKETYVFGIELKDKFKGCELVPYEVLYGGWGDSGTSFSLRNLQVEKLVPNTYTNIELDEKETADLVNKLIKKDKAGVEKFLNTNFFYLTQGNFDNILQQHFKKSVVRYESSEFSINTNFADGGFMDGVYADGGSTGLPAGTEQQFVNYYLGEGTAQGIYANGGSTGLPEGTQQHFVNYYLGEGSAQGIYAEGGAIKNQYEGRTPKDVWNNLTIEQRGHFLHDHNNLIDYLVSTDPKVKVGTLISELYSPFKSKSLNYSKLNKYVKQVFEEHIETGQYAMGGSLGNHGLKEGDQVLKTMSGGIQKVKTKSGDIVYVNLANGYRGAEPPLPFDDGGMFQEKMKWQDAEVGDSARVKEIDRMGLIVKAYGRKFHLRFPNGTEKTFDANELEFIEDNDDFKHGGRTRERKYVNYGQDYEVRYSKDKPKRRGYGYADGGSITLTPETPLARGLGISYTGLVGETGAMSSGEMFADGGTIDAFQMRTVRGVDNMPTEILTDEQKVEFEKGGGVGKSFRERRNEYLEKLGQKEGDVWDKIGANSGADIRNSDKLLKAYAEGVDEMLQKEGIGKGSFDQEDYDYFTDENWHLFNEFLVWNSYYEPEMTKNEKAWREKMYEEQMREKGKSNYVSNPKIISLSGGSKSKSTNYVAKAKISTITIVKDGKEIVLSSKDVLNGVNLYDGGGKLKNDHTYFAKRYVKEVITEDGDKLKPSNGYWVKKSALKDSKKKVSLAKKPKFKVDDLVYNKRTKSVGIVRIEDERGETKTDADGNVNTSELQKYNPLKFKNQKDAKVSPSTQKEVDSRGLFNPFSVEKMSGGGKTKRGGAMVLAKQIRKEGESWASALKRANEQMRNK